jgi:aspartyl-tRNA(Asn)/glutamyl-tRNA(Gln) amidotransferase subunit A
MKSLQETAVELASGKETSVSLTRRCMAHAADPAGEGARAFIRQFTESAMCEANGSDLLRKAGIVPSPLAGIPISTKDLFDVAGETTMAGSVVLKDAPPARKDAVVVQRLRAAGAVIVGRTNMTEFALSGLGLNPHYGTPLNCYDRAARRIPGGSSSGAAVSVADGMAVAAIGTDTGGSVRIPSALCGLTGFKPTAARIPLEGAFPLSSSLDSVGPLAATVSCCALLDSIMAGEAPDIPEPISAGRLCLGVVQHLVLDELDPTVSAAFASALARLSKAGIRLVDLPLEQLEELPAINARGTFLAPESYQVHRKLIAAAEDRYDPRVLARIKRGVAVSAAEYLDLMAFRRDFICRAERATRGFDAVLMPTVAVVAPLLDPLERDDPTYFRMNTLILRNTSTVNFLDGCALSIPCHEPGDLPVGLMVVGGRGRDKHLLAVGLTVEKILSDNR